MSRKNLSASAARTMILAELSRLGLAEEVDHDAVAIVGEGQRWCATLRANGTRIDEALFATVAGIGRRIASRYSLSHLQDDAGAPSTATL